MKCAIGTKLGMTQLFAEDGKVVPVTVVKLDSCTVVGTRTEERDTYNALVLASGEGRNVAASVRGKTKKAKVKSPAMIAEFRCAPEDLEGVEAGTAVSVSDFEVGTDVVVVGESKGKGFQGVVKRHKFAGAPKTHGHKHDERQPGSIGSAFPQHVLKGKRMAGRMGNDRVTIKGVEVVAVNSDEQTIALKGSLPGAKGSYVRFVAVSK